MEVFQYYRNYRIFEGDVTDPFELIKTLSNGHSVGKCYMKSCEGTMTLEEVEEYIKNNHVEPQINIEEI